MATGIHPYHGLEYYGQLNAIAKDDPPSLKYPKFSIEFCEFLSLW